MEADGPEMGTTDRCPEKGQKRGEERFREELWSGEKQKQCTREHTSHLSEGASPDLECFCLIPSTGSSFHAKAHSGSQGGREEKALLSLAAYHKGS